VSARRRCAQPRADPVKANASPPGRTRLPLVCSPSPCWQVPRTFLVPTRHAGRCHAPSWCPRALLASATHLPGAHAPCWQAHRRRHGCMTMVLDGAGQVAAPRGLQPGHGG
jgi:hypothetical protein